MDAWTAAWDQWCAKAKALGMDPEAPGGKLDPRTAVEAAGAAAWRSSTAASPAERRRWLSVARRIARAGGVSAGRSA